jgi:hypothetical protein
MHAAVLGGEPHSLLQHFERLVRLSDGAEEERSRRVAARAIRRDLLEAAAVDQGRLRGAAHAIADLFLAFLAFLEHLAQQRFGAQLQRAHRVVAFGARKTAHAVDRACGGVDDGFPVAAFALHLCEAGTVGLGVFFTQLRRHGEGDARILEAGADHRAAASALHALSREGQVGVASEHLEIRPLRGGAQLRLAVSSGSPGR